MINRNFKIILLTLFFLAIGSGYISGSYFEKMKITEYENLNKEILYKKENINFEIKKTEMIKKDNLELKDEVIENQNSILKESKSLVFYEKINGNRDIKGPGIEIVLKDGEIDKDTPYEDLEKYLKVIHNIDMLNLLNDLKLNGAQSIEINGERVVETSEIYCSFAFISINNKKIPTPFKINVIGNTDKLKKYMERPFNLIENFKVRGLKIDYEFKDNIELKASIPYIYEN